MTERTAKRVLLLAPLVGLLLASCSRPYTRQALPDQPREPVFEAARAVMWKRFGGCRELDEKRGILVSEFRQVSGPTPTTRFYATVEVRGIDSGADVRVRVIQEHITFRDLRMVWVDAGRSDGVRAVEGYILEEIRARLEDREPDLPRDPDAGAAGAPAGGNPSGPAPPAAPETPPATPEPGLSRHPDPRRPMIR